MDKSERIFHLHKMISDCKAPTRKQLMEATQTSKVTCQRDIDHMRTFLGAPIIYCTSRKGYLYDPAQPRFEMPGLWMSPGELHALLACEQLLESVQPGLLAPQLGPLKTRIRHMLSHSGHSYKTVAERIRIRSSNARHPEPNRFAIVAEATLRRRQLLMNYAPRSTRSNDKINTDRSVEPQRLIRYRDAWVLVAWCRLRKGLRYFAVDRITQPRIGDTNHHPLSAKELDRFSNASFGIFSGVAKDWAVLRFDEEPARWVADEHWHPEQIGQSLPDGKYQLQIPYSDERELVMEILKYGAGVEVMGPPQLRANIKAALGTALDRYQTDITG